MNRMLTIHFTAKSKQGVNVQHSLTIGVHNDVVKNRERLLSHCTSIAKKTYGRPVTIDRIVDFEDSKQVLWGEQL